STATRVTGRVTAGSQRCPCSASCASTPGRWSRWPRARACCAPPRGTGPGPVWTSRPRSTSSWGCWLTQCGQVNGDALTAEQCCPRGLVHAGGFVACADGRELIRVHGQPVLAARRAFHAPVVADAGLGVRDRLRAPVLLAGSLGHDLDDQQLGP